MKRINEKGSILIIVMIAAAASIAIIGGLVAQFVQITNQAKLLTVARENTRVGDELAKIVAKAYENKMQRDASGGLGCPSPYQMPAGTGGGNFCFSPHVTDLDNNSNCVKTKWGHTCIAFSGAAQPTILTKNDSEVIEFHTVWKPKEKTYNAKYSLLISKAHADARDLGAPPDPASVWSGANTYDAITCGIASPPAICKKCGPGHSFICYDILYCPVNKPGCTTDHLRVGVMIHKIF